MIEWPLKGPFLFLCFTGDAYSYRVFDGPCSGTSHAVVSTKSLFHVFWEYDVFEFNEPSVVSFPQHAEKYQY